MAITRRTIVFRLYFALHRISKPLFPQKTLKSRKFPVLIRLLYAGCVACRDPFGISRLLVPPPIVSAASARFWPSECKMYNVECKIAVTSRIPSFYIFNFPFSILPARCPPSPPMWLRRTKSKIKSASPFDGQNGTNYTLSQNQIQARFSDYWGIGGLVD